MATGTTRASAVRALLVTDEPELGEAVRDGLDAAAVDGTVTTASGEEVTGMTPDDVDAAIVGDPDGRDVLEVVREVRAEYATLPVVVLLDRFTEGRIAEAVEAGATDYFPHTHAPEQYELIFEEVCGGTGRSGRDAVDELFESVSDGLVVHDPESGEIQRVNERYCGMCGYDREELVGEDIGVVTAPDEAYSDERARERIRRAREEGPQLFEWCNQRRDGETFPVEVHLSVVRLRGEERVLASVRDVSDRRERRRELTAERDRRSVLFENTPDPIVALEFEGDRPYITEVNAAFEAVFGYDAGTIVGERVGDAVVPEREREDFESFRRRAASGERVEGEATRQTADGEREFLFRVLPFEADGRKQAYVWYTDITGRRRRERMVADLHAATERLQEAGTIGEACRTATEAARDVLGLPMTACWLAAGDDAVLEPVAATEPARGIDPAAFEPGDVEFEAYREGEALVYDPSEHFPGNPLGAAIVLPLGDHGLLGVGNPGVTEYEEFVVDAARTLAGHVRTALDRIERAEQLRESERRLREIAEHIDEVIYLATDDFSEILYINPAFEEVYGRPPEAIHEDSWAFLEPVHPEDADAYERDVEAMLADVEAGDPDGAYGGEYRLVRDGETRWIRVSRYPVRAEEGSIDRIVGVVEDVTERKRRERTLETFHGATRELTEANSRGEAAGLAVDAAGDILGFPSVAVHLHEGETGRLEPSAATDSLEGQGSLPAFGPESGAPWQAFVEGEAIRGPGIDDGSLPGAPAPELVLPLGAHGVMLVGGGDLDAERVELAQILAATVEAALNHVEGREELEAREAELRTQLERAERLDRLNVLIRDVEQATIEESTREGIEAAVCDRLAAVDQYAVAWIGDADPRDGSVEVRASAGSDEWLPQRVPGDADDPVAHPATEALETREPQVRRRLAREARKAEWTKRALGRGHQAVVAVPLVHESSVRGVLTVAAEDPTAFDGEELAVLDELGSSIGYEITVLERRRALESDTTTELEFRVEDEDLRFVALSARHGCRVDVERTVQHGDGTYSTFYTVEGVDPVEVVEAATHAGDALEAELVSRDEEEPVGVVEVTAGTWFGTTFTEYGGVVRSALATEGEGRLAVELPGGAEVREVVEAFRAAYPGASLEAKRRHEREMRTLLELEDALEGRLTARQLEALETAYSAGYFEWPRRSSGQEIAGLLGISQPTFNKHLRAAERTVFTMLLDREYPE